MSINSVWPNTGGVPNWKLLKKRQVSNGACCDCNKWFLFYKLSRWDFCLSQSTHAHPFCSLCVKRFFFLANPLLPIACLLKYTERTPIMRLVMTLIMDHNGRISVRLPLCGLELNIPTLTFRSRVFWAVCHHRMIANIKCLSDCFNCSLGHTAHPQPIMVTLIWLETTVA